MQKDSVKGSITVFAALSIMLIAALLFTLLEGARVYEFERLANAETQSAAESLFANYNATLWEEYHMLLLDDGGSSDFTAAVRNAYLLGLLNDNLAVGENGNGNILQGKCTSVELTDYVLIADGKGAAFEAAASAYMKNNAGYEIVNVLQDWADGLNGIEQENTDVEGKMEQAAALLGDNEQNAVDASEKESKCLEQPDADGSQPEDGEAETGQALLRDMSEKNAGGILELVLPQNKKISAAVLDREKVLSGRTPADGTGESPDASAENHLLTIAYLLNHFSNFMETESNHSLQYELEYVIAGKSSDEENLKSVVNRLLLVREISNFGYLLTDSAKVAEAESIATAICTLLYIPEASSVLEYGLLAAWAYAESILDVRALLQGKKIALVKNQSQWSSELSNISSLVSGFAIAKECENGLTYENYLGAMLLLQTMQNRSYRALDAMEITVRSAEQNENFCIDHSFLEADVCAKYSYPTVFWGMESVTAQFDKRLYVSGMSSYSYRKAGA